MAADMVDMAADVAVVVKPQCVIRVENSMNFSIERFMLFFYE